MFVGSSANCRFLVWILLNFYCISNVKDYRKCIISHTFGLKINKIVSLKSYALRAFQQYQNHPNFPKKNLVFILLNFEWQNCTIFNNTRTIVQTIGKFFNVHLFLEDFVIVCMKSTMGGRVVWFGGSQHGKQPTFLDRHESLELYPMYIPCNKGHHPTKVEFGGVFIYVVIMFVVVRVHSPMGKLSSQGTC